MTHIRTASEVFEAIQKVKAAAAAFCTNFFPVQAKLENWIAHQELSFQSFEGMIFFLRKDRDFTHLYFCASSATALGRELPKFLANTSDKLSTDLVGTEISLTDPLNVLANSGFSPYSRLVRLARAASSVAPVQSATEIELAVDRDVSEILQLIEKSFDRFADQLPTDYELEAAITARQIFVIRQSGQIAALLFFETQGLTSTLRYWLVAEQFHSRGFGSALICHYFSTQPGVRRFILWVTATNDNAIQKYQHYGYAPDGLVDHVLVKEPGRS